MIWNLVAAGYALIALVAIAVEIFAQRKIFALGLHPQREPRLRRKNGKT